jgi:protease-4
MMIPDANNLLIEELLKDRKRDRRWRIIRFVIIIILIVACGYFLFSHLDQDQPDLADSNKPYISLVQMDGEIMAGKNFSAENMFPVLQEAFSDNKARGVLIEINSPGGSPVQAGMIHDYILYLKQKYKKKVVILGDDALASGAYLVATSGDKIYVHPDTLTGSIGVIMSGFGFTDAMKKLGISRMVYTAGMHKDRLDPFAQINPDDVTKVNNLLAEVHAHFIADVMQSRKNLKGDPKELFSGDFWTGTEAVSLGLADGTIDRWQLLNKEFGVNQFKKYSVQPSLMQVFLGGASTMLNFNLGMQSPSLHEDLS